MTAADKVVGVIGGMGPDATVDFMARVLAHTPSAADQDHVRMLVDHNPRIPSRQKAMRGEGANPGPVLADMAAGLETGGADFIVMPCNTAHAWQDDIIAATRIPFVSIVEESVRAARVRGIGGPVGVLTTPGCLTAGLYQEALADVDVVLQKPDELGEAMSLIDQIKAGDQSETVSSGLRALAERLVARGAAVLIAACTELPLVLHASMFDVPLVASTDVLAEKTVSLALGHEALPER